MDIELAEEHVFVLDERLTVDEIRQRAMDRRVGAFGSGLGQPAAAPQARRHRAGRQPAAAGAVLARRRPGPLRLRPSPRLHRARQQPGGARGHRPRPGLSRQRGGRPWLRPAGPRALPRGVRRAAVRGRRHRRADAGAASIIGGPRQEVTDLEGLSANDTIVLPPEQRASYVVRQLLGTMMKPSRPTASPRSRSRSRTSTSTTGRGGRSSSSGSRRTRRRSSSSMP